ncbi:MAG TPA: hypothetical protein VFS89_03115 [Nitrosospira sp.]|nr:hypothetical protein [Nitrosospira sp.]
MRVTNKPILLVEDDRVDMMMVTGRSSRSTLQIRSCTWKTGRTR